ncbi:D-alanine transaminase [Geomicrobium halophilum]|uniref:D-alanine aminotransferase n=1 Tax=Geomicrobium halophilum TaxID=549000 RepID=A0A841PJ60_9BACL|nr:D-amino-acid transaminase [Geomicrobium halophilum]MBB6448907.1 D-alanine transaminase [Geomicrobium halophilum]
MEKVLMNNSLINRDEASFSFDDRSMYFGDGVYEVIRVYSGYPYKLEMHLQRLQRSAEELDITYSNSQKQSLKSAIQELLSENELVEDGFVYIQVSRGAAVRDHLYERNIEPISFAFTKEMAIPEQTQDEGAVVYLSEDIRWLRCDIKTVNLLGNIMAKRQAADHDCEEAILHRGETVTEGSSSNIFIVKDGHLQTHPADNLILNGITRRVVIDFAEEQGLSVNYTPFTIDEALEADEAFITSTINEVTPIREWRGTRHGTTNIGPITKQLQNMMREDIAKTRNGE